MEKKTLKSWEDFEQALIEISEESKRLRERPQKLGSVSDPLFRGVSNSEYHLESTLDRIKKGMCVDDYLSIVENIHNHVVTCTGTKWDLSKKIFYELEVELSAYEFMAYLRHNGFPSPLTDWTQSPYIAAFFAFRDIFPEGKQREYVSIFVYREYCGTEKSWCAEKPHIHTLGPTIATDPKHFLQQSEYLFCLEQENKSRWIFADYEAVPPQKDQNIIVKYNIPVSEQQKVLRKLNSMNITAYSLFGSEPSLMETLALRELFLK